MLSKIVYRDLKRRASPFLRQFLGPLWWFGKRNLSRIRGLWRRTRNRLVKFSLRQENLAIKNYNIFVTFIGKRYGIVLYGWRFAGGCKKLGGRFEVVISHDNLALTAAYVLSRRDRARLIFDAVEIPLLNHRSGEALRRVPPLTQKYVHWRQRQIIRRCDSIITIGPTMQSWLQDTYRRPVQVVANAREYEPLRRSSTIKEDIGIPQNHRLLLYTNTLAPGYGFEGLLQSLWKLPPDCHLATLGRIEADYQAELLAQAPSGRLHFLGLKPYDELPNYASGADLGVITYPVSRLNLKLALPNRLFDLCAARLPIVSTDIPSVRELLEEYGIGEIFGSDPADTVMRMLGSLDQYRTNAEAAAEDLSWGKYAQTLCALMGQRPKNIAIVARKVLFANARISRMTETLINDGHKVTLTSSTPHERPHPQAAYHVIDGRKQWLDRFRMRRRYESRLA